MNIKLWVEIDGTGGKYVANESGEIASNIKGIRILKQCVGPDGYARVSIGKKKLLAHRIIADIFIPNPESKRTVNHINGDKADNRASNLEWATYSENHRHSFDKLGRKGGWYGKSGSLHHSSRKTVQLDMQGSAIAVYGSASEASRKTGIARQNICKCCNGDRNYAGGYRWAFQTIPPQSF